MVRTAHAAWRRTFIFVIALFVLSLAVSFPLSAESSNTVRVGWYFGNMFQEGAAEGEVKSGYSYEYLQKIADYTGWRYEYVEGSWAELMDKLKSGEIDVLAGVSKTDERLEEMLFPSFVMGTDIYYLYKRTYDSTINPNDLSTLKGKRVGAFRDNRMTELTIAWDKANGVGLDFIYFNDFATQEDCFERGEIDLLSKTFNNVSAEDLVTSISKIGEEPYYLAISKSRPDLLEQINRALEVIQQVDPFLIQNLQYANYGSSITSRNLTEAEINWVSEHRTLVVGYLENYMPYCSTDEDGSVTGLVVDVIDAILESMGLERRISVQYKGFDNYSDMEKALTNHEINVAFPVYDHMWDLEQIGMNATSGVVTSSESFFFKGNLDLKGVRTISVNENNAMQIAYCRRSFPEATLVPYQSIDECLLAVLSDEVDGTVVNTLRSEMVTANTKFRGLSYVQLDIDDSRCFGVSEDDIALLLLLNRGLRLIGSSFGIDYSYKYMESFFSYGTLDFIRDNLLWIALIAGTVIIVIFFLLLTALRRKANLVREKERHIESVNALKDKADAANAAKTLFLNNMSHDIRTPMNAIIGYTNIASRYNPKPEVAKCFDKIRESSNHLLSLINDVLDISRIESGSTKICCSVTDIDSLTDEVLGIARGYLSGRRLALVVKRDKLTNPTVMADSLRIREVLLNILSNSIKFTNDDGTITFEVRELQSEVKGYTTIRYIISDTGVGMTEEFQKHIFDEFSQENSGARTNYKGTGLGMAITKRYIDMMGGTIALESQKGKGTTFTVDLPLEISDSKDVQRKTDSGSSVNLEGVNVLMAEDNDLNAEIAIFQLEEAGLKVVRAVDGLEAIKLFQQSPEGTFDVILMDLMMPNCNGYDATKAIRSMADRPDGREIPIIALTANAFVEDFQASMDAGMDAHLAKPLDMDEVLKTIARMLRKH